MNPDYGNATREDVARAMFRRRPAAKPATESKKPGSKQKAAPKDKQPQDRATPVAQTA